MTALRTRRCARLSTPSTAPMWRGWSRSAGWRSRRSRSPAASAPARTSHGEARRLSALEVPRVSAGASVERAGRVDAHEARPPLERRRRASRAARRCRRRPGATKPRGLHAGEPQDAAAGLDRAPRLVAVEAEELGRRVAAPRRRRRGAVLEAVLGDRVAARGALGQPLDHLGPAVVEGVQVGRRDDEQRHALDPVVVEPVADERAALEGRGLDVVQGDGDASRCAASCRQLAQVVELLGEEPVPAQAPAQRRRRGRVRAAPRARRRWRLASPSVSPGAKRVRERRRAAPRSARSRRPRRARRWPPPRARRARRSRARRA